ncbi:MAG: DSD1 family PLP-dependent enzyme [Deltaproteobacteria bacterium]|nr:DSD1 family PLP-dependent enzyme [Deltaproteobacteria bacterium]
MKIGVILLVGIVVAAAAALALRPRADGGGYDPYFRALNDLLKREGPARPVLLLDLDRLDRNIDVLRASIRPPKSFRVVDKSLPSIPLLRHVFERAGTRRVMSFHQPFLSQVAAQLGDSQILLGKPMPVRSAERFYADLRGGFDPSRQLQWLIDTPERLEEYRALADSLRQKMLISIEIDVGLHRGGVQDTATLDRMLSVIAAHPDRLELAGFMGYDPHVAKVPVWARSRASLLAEVRDAYRGYVDFTKARYPQLWTDRMTLNGAGSPTYRLYEDDTLLNDLSVGSALVKPTDFDIDTLAPHVPALFIATPVLKAGAAARLPGLDWLSRLLDRWNPNLARTFFIYGGYWMARPVAPAGLHTNPIFGRSSNQEMLNGSARVELGVDDYVFLRPAQSEAVMLQFGGILVVRGGAIVDHWPVFAQ